MSKANPSRDRDHEWRVMYGRAMMLIVVIVAASVLGILAYRWISSGVKAPVGDFYQKTVDADK